MQSTLSAARAQHSRDTLEAMARMARATASVVHVVVQREPGVVENARVMAHDAGVAISVDLMAFTARVRFDGTSA
jgi:hypothetical protein